VLLNELRIQMGSACTKGGRKLSRSSKHRILSKAFLLRFRKAIRRFRGEESERGSNLVEYGIVLALLLMMLFGLIDFGRALYAYHFVSEAAREGTRYAMVRGSRCDIQLSGCVPPPGYPDIQTYLKNVPAGIDPAQLTVTPTWNPNGSANCPGPQIDAPGCVVEVQVSYNFNFMLPFLPRSTVVMQSSSEMVISQ
jgi:TadE-like protein